MARKRVVKEGTSVREVVLQNPKTGANESYAILPLQNLVEEYANEIGRKKQGILDRVFGWFRDEAATKTDMVKDEKTTQLSTIGFGDLGVTRGYHERTRLEHVRKAKYVDYERMDTEGTIGQRALNVTVNNAFMSEDGDQDSYEVDSKNSRVLSILKDLDERTDLKDESPGIMRSGLKFGDSFEELCFDPGKRLIERIAWINPVNTERNEDKYGRLVATKAFLQRDAIGDEELAFQFWQVVHTRYNHERGNRYGTSFFDASRRPFKVCRVMEDGVAINRISRSVDRIVFYVPTGRAATEYEKEKIVNDAMRKFRKRVAVDSNGNMDLTRAPFGDSEDIYIGVESKDSPAKVEMLKGTTIIGQLGDVEYFRNLQIMGYGVPKSYLQLEADVNCLSLETAIPCLDGESRTLGKIVDDYEMTGELPWVYSWDKESGKVVPGQVEWAGVTRKNAEVVEVVLDDGTVHRCTPDHVWFALDGTEIKAEDLGRGQQLLPLRRAVRDSKPNHRVVVVRRISAREDTGDITVTKYSNFFIADASNGGVLVHNSKATLGHEDIEFARMIRSVQKCFSKFLRGVYNRQLSALGVKPEAELYFIEWPSISFIDQQMRAQVDLLKWQIAALAKQTFGIPTPWLLSEIIGLDDDDIHEIESGLEEPVVQQPGGPTPFPGGQELGQRGRESVRDQYFGNRHLVAELADLKAMLTVVASERLNQTMAA